MVDDLENIVEKVRKIDISRKTEPCPGCRKENKRHSFGKRELKEIGISSRMKLEIRYSKHYCSRCEKHYSQDMTHLAEPHSGYSSRAKSTAKNLAMRDGLTFEKASQKMASDYHIYVPPSTIHGWVVDELKPRSSPQNLISQEKMSYEKRVQIAQLRRESARKAMENSIERARKMYKKT